MKRKLLSILLTLCLAFSLLPTAALADGEKVAQVGETKYATLQEAVNAANDNTVKLLENVTEDINIPTGINVTLDLNGHKITNVSGHTITVEKGGKLNISDSVGTGVVDNTSHGKGAIVNSGEVTLNGGTFKRSAENGTYSPYGNGGNSWYTIANYGTMEINTGVTVENAGGYSSMIRNGGDVTADCNLTIKGGNFTGGVNTVKNDSFGVLTINGGNFSNTAQYVIMNWNKAEITAGTFQTLDTASAVLFTSAYGGDANTVGKLTISGGEFKHASDTQEMIVDHYDASNSGTAAVTGGKFDADISKYIPTDYVQSADGTVEKLGETNAVAKVGGTYYKTLAEAVAAADNATVTLLKNTTEDITIASDKTVTLDLAGHKLTNVSGHTITNNGTLFVTGNGTVDNIAHGKGALYNNTGATATLNGGTFTRSAEKGTASPDSANGNSWYTVKNYGTMTINSNVTITNTGSHSSAVANGWFDVSKAGSNGEPIYTTNAVLTINGGNISGGKITVKNDDYGTLTITGGSISQPLNGLYCIYNANVTAISGGNVNGPVGNYNGTSTEADQGKFSITGGYFTSDPTAYLAASHYVWASDKDGYAYMVKDNAPTSPEQKITVIDKTDATVSDTIKPEDKTKIEEVKDKANVDGVAEAVTPAKKADIVSKSNANPGDNDKVEIEVAVKVVAKTADLAKGQLTFEASPVATVKVNGAATGTTVPVTNDMLNGQPITVKLPLPTVDGKLFTPEQIKHISSDGSVEYFLKTAKRGAKTFEIKDDCAVFKITKFSTFELSGTVTYVEPSYSSGSSYDPTYSVSTPSKTEHGTVTVSPKSASKGDTVTVTVKPDSGYVLETLTVTDKNGNELTLKDKGNGKYTFTMPAGKVEVKATFMEDNSMLNFFYDVPNNAYFYEAVKWAVKNGITDGVGNNLFAPEQPCTRAQIVTFLWRAAGSPEPKGAASGMTDVVSGSYYEKAVAWAIENGITTGTTTSTFSPDATCTRAQAVTFLARALKAKAASAAEFSDVPTGSYFADAVAWAAANGVTEGIGGGLFGSDNDCTRGQIVTFLYRAYNK